MKVTLNIAMASLIVGLIVSCNQQKQASEAKRPNILFCISDDQSFPHTSAYGTTWVNTPAFDRVAEEGILFMNAYTPNAKCAPSRSAILTGRNSWQLEAAANHVPYFPEKFTTYVEALENNGYYVGYTGKGWSPGNPGMVNGRKRQLAGQPFNQRKLQPPTKAISPIDYAANFEVFLDSAGTDQPFCFWYGAKEPHRRYEFGTGESIGGKNPQDIDRVFGFWPDTDTVRTDMLDYAFEIEHFDKHLTKILALLEERGELDNTIVVVTSDNGMPFPRIKGAKYEYSNHLPLAIMWKNGLKAPGRVVEDFISFIDFAPTFLELAGVDRNQTTMQPMQGASLTDIIYSEKGGHVNPGRDHVLIGKERHDLGRPNDVGYPVRGIVKDGYLYLRNFEPSRWPAGNPETGYMNTDGSPTKTQILNRNRRNPGDRYWQLSFGKLPAEELYHIVKDPECINNLADSAAFAKRKAEMNKQLFAELADQEDPRILGNRTIFDNYPYSEPERINFYERFMSGELTRKSAGWVNPTDFERDSIDVR